MSAHVLAPADRARERERMVQRQLAARGVSDPRVLNAFREVPREAFVDEALAEFAYDDAPLPIAQDQTISQPYERVFRDSRVRAGSLGLRSPRPHEVRAQLLEPRLERAIGVVYRPESELLSHYFGARLPLQFDEYVWFDETTSVTPFGRAGRAPLAEGHPFATLDI
jgi:hypothetical protein